MNRSVEDVIKFMGRTLHLLTLAIGSTVPGTYLADEPLLFTEPFFFLSVQKNAPILRVGFRRLHPVRTSVMDDGKHKERGFSAVVL